MIPARSGPSPGRPHAEAVRPAIRTALAALLLISTGAVAPATPESIRGTYRLHGTARVAAGAVLDRELELRADAVLDRGRGAREVRIHVAAEGYGCDLEAQLDAAGTLTFRGGQTCPIAITSPDARGRLEGRLRTAHGRVDAGHLTLALSGEVEGTLSRKTGGVRVLGQELPATWTPELPVHGSVEASAEGDLDRSRAAQR